MLLEYYSELLNSREVVNFEHVAARWVAIASKKHELYNIISSAVLLCLWKFCNSLSPCSLELISQISSHPAVFFSHNKPTNSTFSHNKPAKRTGWIMEQFG
jgi:hypothetical protein